MNNEELEKLIKSNIPTIPHIEYNSKNILQKCKIQKEKHHNQLIKYVLLACCCIVLCVISVASTAFIINNDNSNVTQPNINYTASVDRGKDPGLSRTSFTQEQYEARKRNNPDWEPVFDRLIAFGPESRNGFKLDVIYKSNLLSEENKLILLEYETNTKKTYPKHNIVFEIAFGIKDNKDYIYLIDYCGYDINLGKDVNNIFLFESNLPYSFESIINKFQTQTGLTLSDEFLSSSYYDWQNNLITGIIIAFMGNYEHNHYQEYYIVKLDGKVYAINMN